MPPIVGSHFKWRMRSCYPPPEPVGFSTNFDQTRRAVRTPRVTVGEEMAREQDRTSGPPGPHGVRTFDELVARLGRLRAWSGLGYHEVHRRAVAVRRRRGIPAKLAYNTVYRCFQQGRSRLDVELVVDIARVLLGDDTQAEQWRAAYQVVTSLATDAEIVTVSWALPDELAEFTGRRAELDLLLGDAPADQAPGDQAPGDPPTDRGPAPTAVVHGMAGVGKTQLAIRAGHRLLRRGHGADLQLWVNLRGHDPERPPADPAAVLGAVLRKLGVPGDQLFHLDLARRAARYRRQLARRRALIVLDNAGSEEQVRPLLPDVPSCLTLVTCRGELPGLLVARRIRLDVFSAAESLQLLRRAGDPRRVDADPETAAGIAGAVGHLPLAIGLVARRMAVHPDWTLADQLTRLVERHRLRRLDDGVELALHTSYQAMTPPARRMLRLLALHPADEADTHAAAALAGTGLDHAAVLLDELTTGNLLQRAGPGRFSFHDLVRLYANARAVDDEPASARTEALTRVLDNYLHTAVAAMAAIYPARWRGRQPGGGAPATPVPPVAEPDAARAWLDAQRPSLLAAIAYAAGHGWPAHANQLATTLGLHLGMGGHYGDAIAVQGHALAAARAAGDRAGEAAALVLGVVFARVGRLDRAVECSRQALDIFRELGDRTGAAMALSNLGYLYEQLGRYQDAIDHGRQAVGTCRELGDRAGESAGLSNLALAYQRIGRHEEAIRCGRHALAINRELGDRRGEAIQLNNLGVAMASLGRHRDAADHLRRAVAAHREIGFRNGEGLALTDLGTTLERTGAAADAIAHHKRALAIARETGDTALEVTARNNLGRALTSGGRPGEARRQHEAALALARTAGIRYEYALAHGGLADALRAAGDPASARRHWQAALAVHDELRTPEADRIRAHLAGLAPPTPATGSVLDAR